MGSLRVARPLRLGSTLLGWKVVADNPTLFFGFVILAVADADVITALIAFGILEPTSPKDTTDRMSGKGGIGGSAFQPEDTAALRAVAVQVSCQPGMWPIFASMAACHVGGEPIGSSFWRRSCLLHEEASRRPGALYIIGCCVRSR